MWSENLWVLVVACKANRQVGLKRAISCRVLQLAVIMDRRDREQIVNLGGRWH